MSKRLSIKKTFLIVSILFLALFFVIAFTHHVPKLITAEDKNYIYKIIEVAGYDWDKLSEHTNFDDEINDIRAIQKAVLDLTPVQKQVPFFRPREPKDLYTLRYAQCSDRSRVMDKTLRLAGFNSRIASIYGTSKTNSAIQAFLSTDKTKVQSHSMVEVLTSKGWMMVDTNDLWVGLDKSFNPLNLGQWQNNQNILPEEVDMWHPSNKGKIYPLMKGSYTYLYGFYGRHGYFYPPYNFIPDMNWVEFLENFKPASRLQ